ncbi:MAG: hypothetical protein LBT43_21765 [Prevotella sp.]|jgi:hypothetical protein|uniref:Uncharacterized protein n=2 Tax=Dysgonomonas TaxID=156973 RepID=F5IXU6_9BACT|nr:MULTISPECIES: hypothetical protein [Dysgonomonas]EGK01765.1 hypothetical protein HMPREF9455_01913 [Dysgonomonas gadei ATCC BAA-286]MBF0651720.1 hypothetical protein [Dysgonomonas sp. GY75]MDR1505087.1 hypothetical protein [Prevotella sp.]SBV92303.1 conserved hypothetical protein [uncultured Dysgonomonas sp.]
MKKNEIVKSPQDFVAYEEARKDKSNSSYPAIISEKEVKAALNKINPDEDSMKSRG